MPVRNLKFRRGFSSKTLAKRLKELDEYGILERQAYNESPPRVEYRLINKGQELVESVIYLLNWMKNGLKTRG
jgi:DNA-binding HxlR family transcriptional regulator